MTIRNALDVIFDALPDLGGMHVLDVGCGKGGLRHKLREKGANWRGLEPYPPADDPEIDRAGAEAMPYPDQSFDAAICVNALHHVPVPVMGKALAEVARVLKAGGDFVVIEPKAEGQLSQVIAVVDDETEIRGAAQTAMDATKAMSQVRAYAYDRTERYADFKAFCDSLIAVDPARAGVIAERRDALAAAFDRIAGWDGALRTLDQPMSVRIFKAP